MIKQFTQPLQIKMKKYSVIGFLAAFIIFCGCLGGPTETTSTTVSETTIQAQTTTTVTLPVEPAVKCVVAGCKNELCVAEEKAGKTATSCVWTMNQECLKFASCEYLNGRCQWVTGGAYDSCMMELSEISSTVKIKVFGNTTGNFTAYVEVGRVVNLSSGQIYIQYDTDLLSLENARAGELIEEAEFSWDPEKKSFSFITAPVTGFGELVEMDFAVLAEGETSIWFTDVSLINAEEIRIPLGIAPLSVKVTKNKACSKERSPCNKTLECCNYMDGIMCVNNICTNTKPVTTVPGGR